MSATQAMPRAVRNAASWRFALVAAVALGTLLPFLDKPLHIDDPVYVRVAQHIRTAPADFYGFEMNWHGRLEPVADFNKNPPGVSYYLAAASLVTGWSERGLHAAMLVAVLAALAATAALARELEIDAFASTLVLFSMPGFLVAATTLMADPLLVAFWCASLAAWVAGLRRSSPPLLLAGAVLAGLAAVTKYVGIALIPLLAACTLLLAPRKGRSLAFLLVSLAMVAAFDLYARRLYGHSPLLDVGGYALEYRPQGYAPLDKVIVGLSFLGGSLLSGLFFAPLLWSRDVLLVLVTAGAAVLAGLIVRGDVGAFPLWDDGVRWGVVSQLALFVLAGLHWLALGIAEMWRRRDGVSVLLVLWLFGIVVFAAVLNWSTNARALVLAAPAAALLVAGRLDGVGVGSPVRRFWPVALAPGLAVAVAVAWGDARLAATSRKAAVELTARHSPAEGTLWFRGAWGFHHYAKRQGARKIDEASTQLAPGDIVLVPLNNSGAGPLLPQAVRLLEDVELPVSGRIATMSAPRGAGFYSDIWGPLPYALGAVPPEVYQVLELTRPLRIGSPPS